MIEQSVNPSTLNLRSKGLTNSMGKLHKGCVKDATTKLSIGSIPSTYQSIIYKSDNKKAFGTSEKRFYQKQNSQLSQPNTEQISTVQSYQSETKINHNRHGQNAFISKMKREWVRATRTPGPTHYHQEQNGQNQVKKRKCFTRQARKNQEKNYFIQRTQEIKQSNLPGPGQYIHDRKQFWNSSYKGWKSSFQTKVSRDGYIPQSISPGPGYYQYAKQNKQNQKKSKQSESVGQKSKANALTQLFKQKRQKQPGPGTYNQQIPNFKPLYQRIKMSGNFMGPVFNGKKRNKGVPGPTAYKVKRIYDDLSPKLIQSTFFMSETKRQPFQNINLIGPNPTIPFILGHKNFHFNIKNEWMC